MLFGCLIGFPQYLRLVLAPESITYSECLGCYRIGQIAQLVMLFRSLKMKSVNMGPTLIRSLLLLVLLPTNLFTLLVYPIDGSPSSA
jgi:hypothetical protein